ncbi:putative acetyltransferase [Orbus hercynius]|uniref:Putative acetyltransferase n=1 Tax=Orbus hercynius TaxID=593135 RepID=A0A495RKG2_9GAMM|nr:GNAT family N-acetyltransferase [Orbus hercynius]RKS87268.1 putative acetyltransferase [Orbus hercynius]
MLSSSIRDKLTIKPVTLEHLDQFNELLRYVFQVTSRDIEESGYQKYDELLREKRPVLQDTDVIGWFNKNKLVSQLCIYPCKVNIHNKIFEMAGLTGVGTYPEYANLGLMNDLIQIALKKMRDNQQWISYLYPYSVPFYRKKGWEIFSEFVVFNLKDSQLPRYDKQPGFVERLEIDEEDVIDVYNRFSQSNHGALIRSQLSWDEYWRWENENERTAAVYYDQHNQPTGVMFYWINKDVFYIKDLIYLTQEARKGLWNFVYAHYSMVDKVKGRIYRHDPLAFQLQDSKITETIEPYYMARIVDVAEFLKAYPFKILPKEPFHFVVTDPVAEWNNGIFSIYCDDNGQLAVDRQPKGKAVGLTIQTLSSMLMSFRRPQFFFEYERLQTDQAMIVVLEQMIPAKQPYFSDYF